MEEVKMWGGRRKGAGRPKKLPTPRDYEMRRSHSLYATEPEIYFVKKMLEAIRGQRDFTEAEKKYTYKEMICVYQNSLFDNVIENQD